MLIYIITLAFLTIFSIVYTLFGPALHVDVLFFLNRSSLITNGAKMYVDYIDINSPLMFDYFVLIRCVSSSLNIDLKACFIVVSTLLISSILYITITLIEKQDLPRHLKQLMNVLILIHFLFPGENYMQRDYIVSLVAINYVLSCLLKDDTRSFIERVFTGSLFGFLVMLKPHYFVIPIIFELISIFWYKKKVIISGEIFGFALGLSVSLFGIYIRYPEYIQVLRTYGSNYSKYATNMITLHLIILILQLILMAILLVSSKHLLKNKFISYFIVLYFLAVSIMFWQNKGFSHHYYLCTVSATVVFVYIIYNNFKTFKIDRANLKNLFRIAQLTSVAFTIVYGHILNPIILSFSTPLSYKNPAFQEVFNLSERYAKDSYYAALSPQLNPFSLVDYYTTSRWALTYFNLWYLPGYYDSQFDKAEIEYNTLSTMSDGEKKTYRKTISDFIEKRPNIIFVENRIPTAGFGDSYFDILGYYLQDGTFREFFKDYVYHEKVLYDQYAVYIRT